MGISEPGTDDPHDSEQEQILNPADRSSFLTSSSSSRSPSPTPSHSSSTSRGSLLASEFDSPSSSLLIPVHRNIVNGFDASLQNPRRPDSSIRSLPAEIVRNPNPNQKPKKYFRFKFDVPLIGPSKAINHIKSVSNLSEISVSSGIAGERCGNCVSHIATNCTALCCCPLALLKVLVFVLLDLPYSAASKMVSCIKNRASKVRRSRSTSSSAPSSSVFNPTWSFRETMSDKEFEAQRHSEVIRFDDDDLLNHFQTEGHGFFH